MSDHYLKRELYQLIQRDPAIFEFLQAGSLDGIWYWDLENTSEEWMSARFKEIFGYEDYEVPNNASWWQSNIFPEDLEVARQNAEKHFADPSHPYDQVVRYRHKDGSTVWVRCRGMAIRDATGKPIRMLGAHTDVTALKNIEAVLQQKNQVLARSNRDLEQFARIVSHDLKEPLRVIASFTELLWEDYAPQLDERAREYIDFACEGARRLQNLINDLLTVGRIGREGSAMELVALDDVLTAVEQNLQLALAESGGRIVRSPLPRVRADRTQMTQVLQNLLSNAIKFRRGAPVIEISSAQSRDMWELRIADNGIGFDMEHAERVFDMFQRLHPRGTYEGTGIGLSIVRRVVEHHGGQVRVESTPGQGSTFWIRLPVAAS